MIKPLGTRLLIEPYTDKDMTTKSGIVIGEVQVPQSMKMKVLAVGPEVKDFAENDLIFVSQFAPTECRENAGEKTMVVPCEDVLAKLVKE